MDKKIVAEIAIALADIGAKPELLDKIKKSSIDEIYEAAERLGAQPLLLGFIGSWGDTLGDDEVLQGLRNWSAETKAALN